MTMLVALFAFYLGGAVSAALFTVWNVRVFGACGLLPHSVAYIVARTALLWPVTSIKFAIPPRKPKTEV